MDTNAILVSAAITLIMNGVMFGGIKFFLRREIGKYDEDKKDADARREKYRDQTNQMCIDIKLIKKDMEILQESVKPVIKVGDDVAVLKRDQRTIWKNIDEMRETQSTLVKDMREVKLKIRNGSDYGVQ